METFIKAVEKLVIKNVVEYADCKISAASQIISKSALDYPYDDNGILAADEPTL